MKKCLRFGIEVEDVTNVKENINNFYSQAHQDLFVLGFNNYKQHGTYVDIGCSMPRDCNNTYLLEKFKWKGINIDIRSFEHMWNKHRINKFIAADATKLDYIEIFKQNFNNNIIDYLSFDVDEASNNVLPLLPFNEYIFNIITIEHDLYRGINKYKILQEEILTNYNYKRLIENVLLFEKYGRFPFEDWWISKLLYNKFEDKLKNIKIKNIYSDDILKIFNFNINRNEILENKYLKEKYE